MLSVPTMDEIGEDIQKYLCDFFKIKELRKHQISALHQIIIGKKDVLIILPTGMGKSLCYEALTVTKQLLNPEDTKQDLVLLISPLKFLMSQQEQKLQQVSLPAIRLSKKPRHEDIVRGKYRYHNLLIVGLTC